MVRSVTHEMLPQATADEVSRQQFIVALKQGLNRGLRSTQGDLFERVVAPTYAAQQGHPPRDRDEIRTAMQAEPAYQTWSALARAAQEQVKRLTEPLGRVHITTTAVVRARVFRKDRLAPKLQGTLGA